jgi:NAD(P)-dependent dehydrogenase (short-subunit alcohol dehydrogenase family)
MRLQDKVALITGGNSGIGRATALLFAEEGTKVAIAARDRERGRDVVSAIQELGGEAVFLSCDVSKAPDYQRVVDKTVDRFGWLDILFNNAAIIYPHKTILDTTEEEFSRTMDVNIKGVYLMSKYAVPQLAEAGGGVIVNTALFGAW